MPGVKRIIAVASGKGGVGKSTVSANLAIALAKTGAKVGLCDCDLYGPSIPHMFGTDERPYQNDEQQIVPIEKYGVQLISMGFLLDDGSPVIVRGPIALVDRAREPKKALAAVTPAPGSVKSPRPADSAHCGPGPMEHSTLPNG